MAQNERPRGTQVSVFGSICQGAMLVFEPRPHWMTGGWFPPKKERKKEKNKDEVREWDDHQGSQQKREVAFTTRDKLPHGRFVAEGSIDQPPFGHGSKFNHQDMDIRF